MNKVYSHFWSYLTKMSNLVELVKKLTNDYKDILSRDVCAKHNDLNWGNNGIGDRWAKQCFNYTSIEQKTIRTYSENEESIDKARIDEFRKNNKGRGIIGIIVHSERQNIKLRPIRKDILKVIRSLPCVSCGCTSNIVCDHKNDLYNDPRVLVADTQVLEDFQPLCNHCNLQKRQVAKTERMLNKIYSAKEIGALSVFPFEFPWEKKNFDVNDITTKQDTYWEDPKEFLRKCYLYSTITLPIIKEIKRKYKPCE